MKKVDYIVVGLGIAGICIVEQLIKNNKTFVVYDIGEGSTAKSGGVLNPTVLKYFTAAWNAKEFYDYAIPFYKNISNNLNLNFLEKKSILRIFKNIGEQNDWAIASEKEALKDFLNSDLQKNSNDSINAPHGIGEVEASYLIKTDLFLSGYKNHLNSNDILCAENFQYDLLQNEDERIIYKNVSASKIIFAEGSKVIDNPYFPSDFIIGNKGEYVIIKAPQLKSESMLKGSWFVIPLGNDLYKIGATYNRDFIDENPSPISQKEIVDKLPNLLNCPYEVVNGVAGIRPTTKDRRPILGEFSTEPNLVLFNGLGTRGFLMAPKLANMLYNQLENAEQLPREVDINRFRRKS